VIPALRELWSFRELIMTLAERDLRVRYKQAALGIAWALITPVAMMILFTLVFTKVTTLSTGNVPYPLFAYLGLLPWTFFSGSVTSGGLSLVNNVGLLNKLYCPREAFPLAAMIDAAFDTAIAAVVLIALFPITGFAPKPTLYYLPLLLVVLLIFTLGVTLATSVVVVYMRDLRLLLPLIIQLGMFATPVVYPITRALKTHAALIAYSAVNPLVPVLGGIRACVLYGHAPDWPSLAAGAAGSVLALAFGFMLFKRLETGIADVA
jgi:ABC-2 type transport system permease protein/lipopolysaccharide transport system permease protein